MAKLVFISSMVRLHWGGSEELWSRSALYLKRQGHQIAASVPKWPVSVPKITNLANNGVNVRLRERSWLYQSVRRLSQRLGMVATEEKWLRRLKPDLVVVSQGGIVDGLHYIHICQRLSIPYVVIIQANAECWWPNDQGAEQMRSGYESAQRVYFVSNRNRLLLEDQIGTALSNAEVVWNPVNLPEKIENLPWPENQSLNFACVARLEPDAKGQDILFHALNSEVWKKRKIEVNMYGSGNAAKTLEKLRDRLRLDRVHFKGQVSDIREIWQNNHILVLPSRYEGLPLALTEAMKCGRPAIVTDVAGNTEVAINGETAFVATAPTVSHFSEAMEIAWARRSDWQAMGENARIRINQLMPDDPIADFCERLMKITRVAGY